ncbi:DUF4129 domain-containing protein [Paramicrobacterium chengjingii]|uniref:DUF4129 domain-containing protein n=1 Tax=Paramicrobacterium chengjingii TaxID=2769067 RepID=A0ABX6YNT3_9MICO|nr:DUF4129 domain-containing protein [Microbacterium chengjingii]QPZ39960.1 DUF4129 domain-containing protein [Microbacterium chengjingii]
MSRRYLFPAVVVCAVLVVVIAALQGPLVVGAPRIDLILPQVAATPPPATEPAAPGNTIPANDAPESPALLNPTTILFALGSLAAAALVIAGFLIVRALRRRQRDELDTAAVSTLSARQVDAATKEQTVEAPTVVRGIERALGALDAPGIPHDAIVEAWLGLQQSAEDSGVRLRASETPTEFTVRVLAREHSIADELSVLVSLYQSVRFGDRHPTASDIDSARSALLSIQEAWS